jgi:hypothetical protein
MKERWLRGWRRALMVALILVGGASAAWGSHYSLDKADFVSAPERKALARAGIFDTLVLFDWTAPRDKRDWLARATEIAPERLEALARRCDLLRIRGIGPSVTDSLTRAGAPDARALGRALAEPLLSRMRQVTKGTPAHFRLPAEDTLASWIAEARLLRPLIE